MNAQLMCSACVWIKIHSRTPFSVCSATCHKGEASFSGNIQAAGPVIQICTDWKVYFSLGASYAAIQVWQHIF
ncbi:MAG: hypothetical protein IPP49_10715 [Saprospiraceae bacterium]|nr:hypothetical protein [Saprospiraceae bacterium]